MRERLCRLLGIDSQEHYPISKKDIIILISLVLIAICVLTINSFLPDSRTGRLRTELARQGYYVEHIHFEHLKDVET